MSTVAILFNISLNDLAKTIRQEKENFLTQIGKGEVKLLFFIGVMIIYIENPNMVTETQLELIKSSAV